MKCPPQDERKVCHFCRQSFRCPLAQPERFLCQRCGSNVEAQARTAQPEI